MVALLIMDQSTEAIYKLCALIALLGLASPRDNNMTAQRLLRTAFTPDLITAAAELSWTRKGLRLSV